jgi:hypothetical protein
MLETLTMLLGWPCLRQRRAYCVKGHCSAPVPVPALHRSLNEYIMLSIDICEYPILVLQPTMAWGGLGSRR